MNEEGERPIHSARYLPAGCFAGLASALVTCFLLLLNGSIVLGVLDALPTTTPKLIRKPEVVQFMVFALPVLLLVLQWIVLDWIRQLLMPRFRRGRTSPQESTGASDR